MSSSFFPSCFREQFYRVVSQPSLTARLFSHVSGLEVLCLECSDIENMFALGIPTPPLDNTGVAHIMEHAVLAGSHRYPVSDPFMEMIKTSMATFINALTYNDYTAYPVASVVPVDFFNLAAVYWDAVFAPLLSNDSFRQEGWRLELARPGDLKSPLVANGIVLNEMRAAESELENILEQEISRRLLPRTNRACNAGGNPEEIVNLKYQDFLDFHRQHYHPARVKLFFYGNIPTADKLAFVAENLERMTLAPPPKPLPPRRRQTRWQKPRQCKVPYTPVLRQTAQNQRQTAWAKAFFLTDELDPLQDVAFTLLDHLLMGHDAAPLKQKILASGLVENILNSGFDNDSPESMFKICLNGCHQQDLPAISKLISNCLAQLAQDGFSTAQTKAAFQQLQLAQREIDQEHCLTIMENVFDAWCLGAEPLLFLDQQPTMKKVGEKLRQEPHWLRNLLREFLVDNPHNLTVALFPDRQAAAQKQRASIARMREIKAGLPVDALARLDQEMQQLQERQKTGNHQERLNVLPRLRREDIPTQPYALPVAELSTPQQSPLLHVDLPSNDITYFQLAFPLEHLPPKLLPHLTTFMHLFRQLGTTDESHDQMATKFANAGASCNVSFDTAQNIQLGGEPESFLTIRLTVLSESFSEILPLFRQRLQQTIFTEHDYIHELLRQSWSSLRDDLLDHGSLLAAFRAAAGLSSTHDQHETWFGITGARACRRLASQYPAKSIKMAATWAELANCLLSTPPRAAAIIGGPEQQQMARDFLAAWPTTTPAAVKPPHLRQLASIQPAFDRHEVVSITGDVGFCARVSSAPNLIDQDSAALSVYAHLLSCGYLWDEIRLQGGAYGVNCSYLGHLGCLQLQSLHDPNPARTYDVFAKLPNMNASWSQEDVDAAIIACSKYDSMPIRPAAAASVALKRKLFGFSEKFRAERRQALLNLTPEQISQAAKKFWQQHGQASNDCAIAPNKLTAKMNFQTLRI